MINILHKKNKQIIFNFLLLWIAIVPAFPEFLPQIRKKFYLVQDWRMFVNYGKGSCKVYSQKNSKINFRLDDGYKSVFNSEKKCVLFAKITLEKYPELSLKYSVMTEKGWADKIFAF